MGGRAPLVEVRGAKELRASMKAAGESLEDMKEANAAVGAIVAPAAQGLAPVTSGALAGSIRPTRAVGGVSIKAGGASIPYAGPIHWGWPKRNIKPHPFLSDAGTSTEDQWTEVYLEALNQILERIEGDKE